MLQAAQALKWKNNGLLAMFGLRLNNDSETRNSQTNLDGFFDYAELCAAAPWWGWGRVLPMSIARAAAKHDCPLHLLYAHPEAHHFDFAYCPPGAPWSLRLRVIPGDFSQQTMLEHGIAAVMSDMRRALTAFNKLFSGNGPNGTGMAPHASPFARCRAKRRERHRQSKPNRARCARRH